MSYVQLSPFAVINMWLLLVMQVQDSYYAQKICKYKLIISFHHDF